MRLWMPAVVGVAVCMGACGASSNETQVPKQSQIQDAGPAGPECLPPTPDTARDPDVAMIDTVFFRLCEAQRNKFLEGGVYESEFALAAQSARDSMASCPATADGGILNASTPQDAGTDASPSN